MCVCVCVCVFEKERDNYTIMIVYTYNYVHYVITSKSPSSGRGPWGKDRRNCNAERGRTKWQPILRHGDAADSGS